MSAYIIRGRCEDGTVYWDGWGWASHPQHAWRYTNRDEALIRLRACNVVEKAKIDDLNERVYGLTVVTAPRRKYGFWRKEKRYFNSLPGIDGGRVYDAHTRGSDLAERGKAYRNPYPQGKRHDAFKHSYEATQFDMRNVERRTYGRS